MEEMEFENLGGRGGGRGRNPMRSTNFLPLTLKLLCNFSPLIWRGGGRKRGGGGGGKRVAWRLLRRGRERQGRRVRT